MKKLLAIALLSTGCKSVECGDGTIDKNGTCVAADDMVSNAKCGPFTHLSGDQCVPDFPPTVCDDGTTIADKDPSTNVTTCVGNGSTGGCSTPLACPAPAAGKQTICGQIYDLATDQPFTAPNATGAACGGTPAASGPCALAIHAYDAIQFGNNPQGATQLPPTNMPGGVYIDDCGRFRIPDISIPSGPLIAVGTDDADQAKVGPAGVTNAAGVATEKVAGGTTRDLELFVATKATTDMWESSGGPPVSGGMAISIFRAGKTGRANQAGVAIKQNKSSPGPTFYFAAAQTGRTSIDSNAMVTGANGTGLFTGASVLEGFIYTGTQGPLPAACTWEMHGAVSLPNILFVQIYRPVNNGTSTCPL